MTNRTKKFQYYEQYDKQDAINNFSAMSGILKKTKNIQCYKWYDKTTKKFQYYERYDK